MDKKVWVVLGVVALLLVGGTAFGYYKTTQVVRVTPPPVTPKAQPVAPAKNLETPEAVANQVPLTITSPVNGAVVQTAKIIISGTTSAKTSVSANNVEGAADANGAFKLSYTLDEGENPIIVTAINENGNYSEREIIITYSPVTQ